MVPVLSPLNMQQQSVDCDTVGLSGYVHAQRFSFHREGHQVHGVQLQHTRLSHHKQGQCGSCWRFQPRSPLKVCSWATCSTNRAFQGSILGSSFWCVRTLDGLWEWPNVIFVEFLARHMVRPMSSLGASSQFPPPGRGTSG